MEVKKVLIKQGELTSNMTYLQIGNEFDQYYYYVYYSYKKDIENNYLVYTNNQQFGESRIIFKSKLKSEAVLIANKINDALRLIAGYYDEDKKYLDEKFKPIKKR